MYLAAKNIFHISIRINFNLISQDLCLCKDHELIASIMSVTTYLVRFYLIAAVETVWFDNWAPPVVIISFSLGATMKNVKDKGKDVPVLS
jgi:hypothetical protein